MMIDSYQKETIRQQCRSFEMASFMEPTNKLCPHVAIVCVWAKVYRFSDPDLNVIIAQLAKLYKRMKNGNIHDRYYHNS